MDVGLIGRTASTLAVAVLAVTSVCRAQDYDRYKPLTLPPQRSPLQIQPEPLPSIEGSDRILVESLDAVLILDDQVKVRPDDSMPDLVGLHRDFGSSSSLVYREGFANIVSSYLGGPITLRRLNELSRDIIQYYRRCGQPVVDVVIPEQRITDGTVQLVVIESRVGRVVIEGGCFFDPCDLSRWVGCTHRGSRIYESAIANDLFWLNQNPFREVDVDLRPGAAEGTTDVVFEVHDVRPVNSYCGYDDTGVRTLMLERLYAGVIWGNAFGRDASLSYQYTADADFRHLHAHAVAYNEPLSRFWSWQSYGSWAGLSPDLSGVSQDGESWQSGFGLTRHMVKNQYFDISLSAGFDFKSTNNNLEFGGVNVQNSAADLVELRFGLRRVERLAYRQYSILALDTFIGPGAGFTPDANDAAFSTIRPDTGPDYIYARGLFERLWSFPGDWNLVTRVRGQATSDRLLFSEMLGYGGFDSIRGYDQRVLSADYGWITNLELGPAPFQMGSRFGCETLRIYGLVDAGEAFIKDPQPGEFDDEFLISLGAGLRWSLNNRTSLRFDYGHGFEPVAGAATRDRVHIGLVTLFGPQP